MSAISLLISPHLVSSTRMPSDDDMMCQSHYNTTNEAPLFRRNHLFRVIFYHNEIPSILHLVPISVPDFCHARGSVYIVIVSFLSYFFFFFFLFLFFSLFFRPLMLADITIRSKSSPKRGDSSLPLLLLRVAWLVGSFSSVPCHIHDEYKTIHL